MSIKYQEDKRVGFAKFRKKFKLLSPLSSLLLIPSHPRIFNAGIGYKNLAEAGW